MAELNIKKKHQIVQDAKHLRCVSANMQVLINMCVVNIVLKIHVVQM